MRFWKIFSVLGIITFLLAAGAMLGTARAATVTVDFTNIAEGETLQLAVGQTYTFEVVVSADEDFTYALMLSDEQFPGKGIKLSGADIQTRSGSALLTLTAVGKGSTADLPGGVAPVSLVVGVRYPGGEVQAQRVNFFVQVP